MKYDGTFDWESKGVYTTDDGEVILESRRGTDRRTGPTTGDYRGESRFITQSPKLAWLNRTNGWLEGTSVNTVGAEGLESRGNTTKETVYYQD